MGMDRQTFFQTCVYFTIIMFVFTLSVNFVSATGIFGSISEGIDTSGTTDEIITGATVSPGQSVGFSIDTIWLWITGGGVAIGASFALAWLTQSAAVLGAGVFGVFFWGSYLNLLGITNIGGYLTGSLAIFITIFTGFMVFMFVGAVIALFGGSG